MAYIRFQLYKRKRTPSQMEWIVDAFIDDIVMPFWYIGRTRKSALAHIKDQYPTNIILE
jgi:hypothetical protein